MRDFLNLAGICKNKSVIVWKVNENHGINDTEVLYCIVTFLKPGCKITVDYIDIWKISGGYAAIKYPD